MRKLKKLRPLLALLAVNLLGGAVLLSRLFGQTGVQVYSVQPDSNAGLWGNRQSNFHAVYYLDVCSNNQSQTNVRLCWKFSSNPATANGTVDLPNGTKISGDMVPVSWQSATYANYPSQL